MAATLEDLLRTDAYFCYIDYIGIRAYFQRPSAKWDYTFRGNSRITMEMFYQRKDAKLFHTLVNKYQRDRRAWQDLFISASLLDSKIYIRDILHLSDELREFHESRLLTIESIGDRFFSDVKSMISYMRTRAIPLDEFLMPIVSSPPILLTVPTTKVSLETIALLDRAFRFTRFETQSPRWKKMRLPISKYGALLPIDLPTIGAAADALIRNTAQISK